MILFFSGTGNTRAVAGLLGRELDEKVVHLLEYSPDRITFEGECLVFLFPVYSWGVAPLILNYVSRLSGRFVAEVGNKPVYVVCTCGDDTGRAPEMFCKALKKCGLTPYGIWSVQMPNNYVILPGFNVDTKSVEERKLRAFPERVRHIADVMRKGGKEMDWVAGSMPGLKTAMVYPLFKRWGIFPSRWMATEACVGCGKCERACPVGNIRMKDRCPEWGKDCVSCLACFHICPRNAVQYGRATLSKGQYFYPYSPSSSELE